MTTYSEPRISIASPAPDRPADRTLTLTFAPDAPLAMIRVDADPALAGVSDRTYLAFLDQALARLQQYRNDYAAAAAAEILLAPPAPRIVGAWRHRIVAARPPRTSSRHRRQSRA